MLCRHAHSLLVLCSCTVHRAQYKRNSIKQGGRLVEPTARRETVQLPAVLSHLLVFSSVGIVAHNRLEVFLYRRRDTAGGCMIAFFHRRRRRRRRVVPSNQVIHCHVMPGACSAHFRPPNATRRDERRDGTSSDGRRRRSRGAGGGLVSSGWRWCRKASDEHRLRRAS